MTFYSESYKCKSLDYQDCYKYGIAPFTVKHYLTFFSTFGPEFHNEDYMFIAKVEFALIGYKIAVSGGDPYDQMVPIALASEFAELQVLADINGLDPLIVLDEIYS